MKKIILSLITFLYLMLSTGFSVEMHYCMGKFSGVDFCSSENKKCSKCGMTEKKTGCCKDELKFFKLNDNFKNNNYQLHTPDFKFVFQHQQHAFLIPENYYSFKFHSACNFLKPHYSGPPIYISNCVFRI